MYRVPAFVPSSERLAEALERKLRSLKQSTGPLKIEIRRPVTSPRLTIALSRQAGANVPEIAKALSMRLGWPVYDHELLEQIAQNMGVTPGDLEVVDERPWGWLAEVIEAFRISREPVSDEAYVSNLVLTLFSLASQGECIIVGRGAAQVLPAESTLRVYLVGPREDRIACVQRELGMSLEKARAWVDQKDHERKAFVQDHFYEDPTDPAQYDLVLNVFRYSPSECSEIIITALQQALSQSQAQPSALASAETSPG